jgi:hypothetical protein
MCGICDEIYDPTDPAQKARHEHPATRLVGGSEEIAALRSELASERAAHGLTRKAKEAAEKHCRARVDLMRAVYAFLDVENGGAVVVHPGTDDDSTRLDVGTEFWDALHEAMANADTIQIYDDPLAKQLAAAQKRAEEAEKYLHLAAQLLNDVVIKGGAGSWTDAQRDAWASDYKDFRIKAAGYSDRLRSIEELKAREREAVALLGEVLDSYTPEHIDKTCAKGNRLGSRIAALLHPGAAGEGGRP